MTSRPILLIQMQRMGDLVLTFPLLLWLARQYPDHPLWVVAEPAFFKGLMPLSPEVTYFPPTAAPRLARESYFAVINVSHRPEAARLAGSARCEWRVGPAEIDGVTHIHGPWQLYRASLVQNNRHNLFHWAELNGLDAVPPDLIRRTRWPAPEHTRTDASRVGLFLGASDVAKRPSAAFWSQLVIAMLRRGMKPVLLGGKAEATLGATVAATAGSPALNLCGRFSLEEFTRLTRTLRYLITPDTGPMHVAAWMGTPVLNLSMGHVHPWETGPYQPEHHVLRSTISCTGCWQCKHSTLLCHRPFSPDRVAALVHALIHHARSESSVTGSTRGTMPNGSPEPLPVRPPGQSLMVTGRAHGLYALHSIDGGPRSPRETLDFFWQRFFGAELGLWAFPPVAEAWQAVCETSPSLVPHLRSALLTISREVLVAVKRGNGSAYSDEFWRMHPQLIRPLSGYLHLLLQNNGFSRLGFSQSLAMLERLTSLSANA